VQILAGDIGGTHTRLRRVQCHNGRFIVEREQVYDSQAFPDLLSILRQFLKDDGRHTVLATCLAVAGPVQRTRDGQHAQLTNLPWHLDSRALAQALDIRHCRLINDFAAVAHGIDDLDPREFETLQDAAPDVSGVRAVLGAGTGLGQAILLAAMHGAQVLSTEGGHVDFGPTTELELDLARWLIAQRGRACYEDILSGPGLCRIHEFLRLREGAPRPDAAPAARLPGDPAAAITQAALEGHDPLSVATLDLFVRIYGAQAGNLALSAGATGGIYLAGGIAPKIISRLRDGTFMQAFRSKGGMTAFVERIPVRVILATDIGLRGAQRVARQLVQANSGDAHA